MKMILLSVLFSLVFVACNPKEDDLTIVTNTFLSHLPLSDTIIAGDENGMIVNTYNKVVQCYPTKTGILYIDPFNYGNSNYNLEMLCVGKPLGGSFGPEIYIDAFGKIGGDELIDTIFTSKKVYIYYDSIKWKKMVKGIVIKSGCFRFYPDDSIRIKESNIVKVYKEGEMIFKNSGFISGKINLTASQGSINPYIGYKGDTVILESNHWDTDCHKLPDEGTFYFAILLPDQNYPIENEKLGWLKFRINSDNKLELVSSAIQK